MDPSDDPTEDDLKLWRTGETDLDLDKALHILSNLAKDFCKLCIQERNICSNYNERPRLYKSKIVWKPLVSGFRETCDECSTTIFNYHFICKICGFSVCFECCEEGRISKTKENEQDVLLLCKRHLLTKY